MCRLRFAKAQIDFAPSPYFSEFAAKRPVTDRRAPSLRAHVIGEKGPSTSDVTGAALRTLREMIGDCHSSQLANALEIILACIDKGFPERSRSAWDDEERCCWLTECITGFTLLQYRYAMPASLLEAFMGSLETSPPVKRQVVLLKMLVTILKAEKLSLTGVSPTEILNSLLTAIIARMRIDLNDPLVVFLVEAVEAIGSHVYYADQANDMVEDVVSRIVAIQAVGPKLGSSRKNSRAAEPQTPTKGQTPAMAKANSETIRILVICMTNVMLAGLDSDGDNGQDQASIRDHHPESVMTPMSEKGKGRDLTRTPVSRKETRRVRRNPITPEVWQDTLPLLCESTFAVRTEYARSLLLYVKQELPAYQDMHTASGQRDVPPSITRFHHALMATLYTLAITSKLGFAGPAVAQLVQGKGSDLVEGRDEVRNLPLEAVAHSRIMVESPTPGTQTPEEPAEPPKISRRTSKLVALPYIKNDSLVNLPGQTVQPEDTASSLDYLFFREIVSALVEASPKACLVTATPMLLALDRDAGSTLVRRPQDNRENVFVSERRKACREVICSSWLDIAKFWNLKALSQGVHEVNPHVHCKRKRCPLTSGPLQVYSSMGHPPMVHPGPLGEAQKGVYMPADMVPFPAMTTRGETSLSSKPVIHPEFVSSELAESRAIQSTINLDRNEIVDLLSRAWTVQWALSNSIESPGGDFTKAAMFVRRQSYNNGDVSLDSAGSIHSFSGSNHHEIDVADLREALGQSFYITGRSLI